MPVHWYLGFRSLDLYYDKYGCLPGTKKGSVDDDSNKLIEIQTQLMKDLKITEAIVKPCLEELSRYGGSQLHNIAATLGGMAAGTIMKVTLQQFFPFNDTYIFNGIHCSGAVFKI